MTVYPLRVGSRDALLQVAECQHRTLRVVPASHALDLPRGYHRGPDVSRDLVGSG